MHPNPAYRNTPNDRNLAFAGARGFGVLMISGADGPLASHVPFIRSDDGSMVDLHLVRSNPIVRALHAPVPAVLAVSGPDSYVSPDWYGIEDQVPTWNYIAVHLRGELSARPEADLRAHLDDLSAAFEARLLPKMPWLADKLPDELLARMMRMIVPCRLTVKDVQGTWKLGQNKPDAARLAAAGHVGGAGVGQETATLATLMRDANG